MKDKKEKLSSAIGQMREIVDIISDYVDESAFDDVECELDELNELIERCRRELE